ncbi:MAG TPA: aldolase, partial [Streptosporangiaceae bacterium]|nr:aldolase [Streptosporangiaceae bacterium]
RTWHVHSAQVRHSLKNGFYQGWDMHPAHLPSRYATVYTFHLTDVDDVISRVHAWREQAAGKPNGVLDEPATIKALTARLQRAVDCGALDATSLPSAT